MRRAEALAARIAALPVVPVLAALIALQLAQAFWFAFNTPHNGWIWYSGGDATEYWTETWALAHGIIPQSVIGLGLPVYYAWVPLVMGTTLMQGAAAIVLFQAIVLVPLALVLFFLIADRLFGRVYAWCAAALWVAGPLLMLHGFTKPYHVVFDQYFLVPHWFGFTNMADLPSLVAVLGCVWLMLRWFETGSATDVVYGGLVAGVAICLKPSNGFIFPALAVLLIGARRPRQMALFFASLVPALVALALWKVRGLGHLPLTTSSYEHVRLAAGTSMPVAITTSKYLQFDWHHLQQELRDLREFFWSLRFLEFLLFAGSFGVIRKHPWKGTFVVVWFLGYGVFKGSSPKADFTSANWFRLAEPGIPAYILIALGVAFCLPVVGRRAATSTRVIADTVSVSWRRIAVPVVVAGVIPVLAMVVAQPASSQHIARDNVHVNEAPISSLFHVRAVADGKKVHLSWDAPPAGRTHPTYEIYRAAGGDGCNVPSSGSVECYLNMVHLDTRRDRTFTDTPSPGRHVYRIGMLGGYRRAAEAGDLMLLSRATAPVRVR